MVGLYFFGIAIIPIAITLICRAIWPHKITWMEAGWTVGISLVVCALVYFTGSYKSTDDIQVKNGEVTGKKMEEVPCEHDYSCNCHTVTSGSGKNKTTHTECDTCYEHHGITRTWRGTDFDWDILTSLGLRIEVDRIDRRGEKEPPRWTKAAKGDPVAVTASYENLVKAVPDSMFNFIQEQQATQFDPLIPPYPSQIFDYHYCNRVISMGVKGPDLKKWNESLANALKAWGPKKQANVIILFVNTSDPKYMFALEKKWLRAKMNDIVVVYGVTSYPKIDWVRVMSWSDAEEFKVSLRMDLEGPIPVTADDPWSTIVSIDKNMKLYKRFDREQLEYLRHEIKPPMWAIVATIFIAIFGTIGLNWWFHKTDTGGERRYRK